MDRAEALMEDHPDSALAILQTVDSASLRGKADKARRALLMSMALDKNHIFATDSSILQPAIDYYLRHGNPDQRLKTRYYQGRIWMNQGDNEKALNSFLCALEDAPACTDTLALARLFLAKSAMHYNQYDITSYLEATQNAKRLYGLAGDSMYVYKCEIKILEGATLNNDTALALRTAENIEKMQSRYDTPDFPALMPLITCHYSFDNDEALRDNVEKWERESLHEIEDDGNLSMNMALALERIGEYGKALKYVNNAASLIQREEYDLEDSIKFNLVASSVYEHCGMPAKALDYYKDYVDNINSRHGYLINSGIFFTKEKHDMEMDNLRKSTSNINITLLAFITFLMMILSVISFAYIMKSVRIWDKFRDSEHRRAHLTQESLIESEGRLIAQHKLDNIEKERLKNLNKELNERIDGLVAEKNGLKELLEKSNDLPQPVRQIVVKRVEILDDFFRNQITDDHRHGKEFSKIIESIKLNQEKFFDYLRESYNASNPGLMSLLVEKGLTIPEMNYACLLLLGLSNKQIEAYLKIKRTGDISTEIRKKLALPPNSSTLKICLKNLM